MGSPVCRLGADRPLHFPGRAPCSPLPRPFCDVSGASLPAMSIDRWGLHIGQERRLGPAGDRPPSHLRRRSNSDHANKRYVFWQNRESGSRPANAISRINIPSLIHSEFLRFAAKRCEFDHFNLLTAKYQYKTIKGSMKIMKPTTHSGLPQ